MKRRLALVIAVLLAVSGLNVVLTPTASAASPANFKVERGNNGYKLTWSPVKGATSYRIYRAEATRKNHRPAKDVEYWTVDGHRWVQVKLAGKNATTTDVQSYLGSSEVAGDWQSAPFAIAAYNSSGTQIASTRVERAKCANSYFISARGTNQNPSASGKNTGKYAYGLGSRGAQVYKQARQRLGLSEAQFQAVSVNYPAFNSFHWPSLKAGIPVATAGLSYRNSVDNGSSATAAKVRLIATKCPSARIILFGYSQGAQAVGNGYQLLTAKEKAKVTQMHLFADPRRRTNDPNVDYQPSNAGRAGVYRQRPNFDDTVKPRVKSWCWTGDDVCSFSSWVSWHPTIPIPARPFVVHGSSGEYECYEKHAALHIAQRARDVKWRTSAKVHAAGCEL